MDILTLRILNQGLAGDRFEDPHQAVTHLGAVQSQDFHAAKWSIGLRIKNSTNSTVEEAFNKGAILRTHIMRPTWHFVAPQNLIWLQNLTSHRVGKLTSYYEQRLGLTQQIFEQASRTIEKSLQDNKFLTRQEIKQILEDTGVKTNSQQMIHIMAWAERSNRVTSGPLKGKQFTYALIQERVKKQTHLSREEALGELTFIYFNSHGPAQAKDFAWWSGLSVKEVNDGIGMVRSKLSGEKALEKTYWYVNGRSEEITQKVFLMSVYDEYFIGYSDRSDILEEKYKKALPVGNALLTSLLIIDGKVEGTWKRKIKQDSAEFTIHSFRDLSRQDREGIEKEAARYGKFFNVSYSIKYA